MPAGSQARLIARMAATASWPRSRTSQSTFATPMPCSALTLPPSSSTSSRMAVSHCLVVGSGAEDVDVQVAVGDVAVDDRSSRRIDRANRLRGPFHQLGIARQRHRDVELVRHPLGIHRLGMALTQLPEPMPPGGVASRSPPRRRPERFERRCEVVGRIGLVRAHLDEQVHRAARRERRRDRRVAHDELEPVIGEQLERRQRGRARDGVVRRRPPHRPRCRGRSRRPLAAPGAARAAAGPAS